MNDQIDYIDYDDNIAELSDHIIEVDASTISRRRNEKPIQKKKQSMRKNS